MSEPIRISVTVGAGRVLSPEGDVLTAAALLDVEAGEYRWESDPGIVTMNTLISASTGKVVFEAGGFGMRALPQPFLAQLRSDDYHDGAVSVGRIEEMTAEGAIVRAGGWVTVGDGEDDPGRRYAIALASGNMRAVSVDAEVLDSTVEYVLDDEGFPVDAICHAHSWQIMGLTAVAFGADENARVRLSEEVVEEVEDETVVDDEDTPDVPEPMAAAVNSHLVENDVIQAASASKPPAEWFDNPQLSAGTSLQVTDEGRVFGHLATWENDGHTSCHVGFGECVCPPKSPDGQYPYFLTGEVVCANGVRRPVGIVSVYGGHHDKQGKLSWQAAQALYDDPACGGALVNVGEDAHGIWAAGMMPPNASEHDRAMLRAAAASGDWRRIPGDPSGVQRLIAACAVISPGFPIAPLVASTEAVPAVAEGPVLVSDQDGPRVLLAGASAGPMAARRKPVDREAYDTLSARVEAAEAAVVRLSAQVALLDGTARQVVREALSAG